MSNHNTAPQPTPPETPWSFHANELYEQGIINAREADIMSGVASIARPAELTLVPDSEVPKSPVDIAKLEAANKALDEMDEAAAAMRGVEEKGKELEKHGEYNKPYTRKGRKNQADIFNLSAEQRHHRIRAKYHLAIANGIQAELIEDEKGGPSIAIGDETQKEQLQDLWMEFNTHFSDDYASNTPKRAAKREQNNAAIARQQNNDQRAA